VPGTGRLPVGLKIGWFETGDVALLIPWFYAIPIRLKMVISGGRMGLASLKIENAV